MREIRETYRCNIDETTGVTEVEGGRRKGRRGVPRLQMQRRSLMRSMHENTGS